MKLSAKEWREHLVKQSKSGLSITEYCGRNELSVPNLYYWRKRVRSETSPVIPVVVRKVEPTLCNLGIRLPNGIQLGVEGVGTGSILTELVQSLMGVTP